MYARRGRTYAGQAVHLPIRRPVRVHYKVRVTSMNTNTEIAQLLVDPGKKTPLYEQMDQMYVVLRHDKFKDFTKSYMLLHDLSSTYEVAVDLVRKGFRPTTQYRIRKHISKGKEYMANSGAALLYLIDTTEDSEEEYEPWKKEPEREPNQYTRLKRKRWT